MTKQERDDFIMERLNAGVSLSDVQAELAHEHGIKMTYLELRLLAGELQVNWTKQDKPKPTAKPAQPAPQPATPAEEPDDEEGEAFPEDIPDQETEDSPAQPGEPGQLSVTLDEQPAPGSLYSGNVTFSDNTTGKWFLDRFGRLSIASDSGDDSYQPSQEDQEAFQVQVQQLVQKRAQEVMQKAHDGRTQVDVSKITRPGCELNGSVTFASGIKGEWLLSRNGLDFDLDDPNAKPTAEDLAYFQVILREKLREQGMG